MRVLGRAPFEDRSLDKEIGILSSEWKRQVAHIRHQLTFRELAEATVERLAHVFEERLLRERMGRLVPRCVWKRLEER